MNRISNNNYFSQSKPMLIMQGFSMRTSRRKDSQWLLNTSESEYKLYIHDTD